MIKYIIVFCIIFFSLSAGYSQINIYQEDSIPQKNTHGVSIEVLGPAFLSSVGYVFEDPFREKSSFQFEFRIAGHFGNYGGKSWYMGPLLKQSFVYGKKLNLKLGLSQGIVFNPPSINGKFDDLQSWDRPLRVLTIFAVSLGSEFQLTKKPFFIIPNFYLPYLIGRGLEGEIPYEQLRLVQGFYPSFGLDLKIKL